MLSTSRVVLVALLLAATPSAFAAWRGAGGLEPDTIFDERDGLMFPDPDASEGTPARQVYFQAFATLPETSLNPNAGLTGTRVLAAPALHHRALLGVWKDCNADGYVGTVETALQDYSAFLLLSDAVCPATSYAGEPIHNDGRWVNEFLTIGMVDPCEFALDPIRAAECPGISAFALNERVIYANDTFVWADAGAPGSIPQTECVLAPLPSGTTTGTGALLGWVDCQSRRGIAEAVNDVDSDGALGLRFEDTTRPEASSSLLNQRFPVTPFGSGTQPGLLQDDTDEASALAWDCSEDPSVAVDDPEGRRDLALADPTGALSAETFPFVIVHALTGIGFEDEDNDASTPGVIRVPLTDQNGRYAAVPAFEPSIEDPTASWWVALERGADGPAGDCDPATGSAIAPAYFGRRIESDATPIIEARKDRTSATFTFYDGHRGLHPRLDPHTGALTPSDGGTIWLDHGRGGDGPLWSALAPSEQDPQLIDREDLAFTSRLYFTYYAALGPGALASVTLPSAVALPYGAQNCGDHTTGIRNGWVCDATLWWRDANGHDNAPKYAQGMRIGRVPGDVYHLRDVDCYDGDLARGVGVRASLVDFTNEGACP